MHLLAASLLVAFTGCGQQEPITSYRVKKPELVDPTLTAVSNSPSVPATEQQTLGLIIPVGDKSWFLKLTGDANAIAPLEQAFIDFAMTVKIDSKSDKGPNWTLPAGWKELPGNGFRFATIQIPADGKPLEISISEAGGDLLANVNRWRQQLRLPAIAVDELANTSKTIKIGEHDATFVSLVGTGSGQMGGAPFAPFAGGGGSALPADHPPLTTKGAPPAAKAAASDGLSYDTPSGWTPGNSNAFSQVALQVVDGDKKAEITVSEVGGDLLSNVNRWRSQIGLSPVDAAELAKESKKIETLGTASDYVELVGPAADKRQSILGVRIEAGGRTWFVKFRGDAKLAEREKPRFEEFVKSLKIP